ncbi:S-adenosyl-L-methionine-dependent methyltransferase [Pseudomassariella vexata]|uniref:catechol O-methyltransferase n=1 Tax=Pseudomassariella vexata TaxID=1141098 RepID=A0A1Y2DS68_9PEZI|nr:S-adenosyl-L-methionine-dependent methyltransferase [Pseudomassariella vexata]ORY62123.1 S-adenosyl-L-methionine-dependent methyltransferase [Pseudomassariella vexata]
MLGHKSFDDIASWQVYTQERARALHTHIMSLPTSPFENKPLTLCTTIESWASTNRLPMIFRAAKMDVARQVLSKLEPKPKVIVEFGTYVGTSALAWGYLLRSLQGENGDNDGAKVYTFELDSGMAGIARDFVKLVGLEDTVHVLEGPGSDSLKKLTQEGKVQPGGVDVVFFDHWEKLYLPDLQLCESLSLFHKGSVAIADNTDIPGAPDYLEYVKKGGSEDGKVRYESVSHRAEGDGQGPKIVEVSTVVQV